MTSKKTVTTFADLGLRPELLSALEALGYEEPTPVQKAALPPMLEGRDVLGQAATGTGKTAAFALPILERLVPGEAKPFEPTSMVVVPTRELAMQVAEAIHSYGKTLGVSVLPVYGGQDIGQQLRRLKRGVDVVVATPGRALDHLDRGTMKLDRVGLIVLDEADEMLDLGFAEDLELILKNLREDCQAALFSATLPPRIAAIADRHLKNPVKVRIEAKENSKGGLPRIKQVAYVVPQNMKELALGRVLDVASPSSAIIFCRTRLEVEHLNQVLNGHGHAAAALHGGLSQEQRDRVLKRFKAHETELLVATDVAARGLHVEKLSHVINFDVPTSPEAYVHRIGRTGRAGAEGHAVTLMTPREHRFLRTLERASGQPIEVAQLPTVVDLKAKKLELTRAAVEDAVNAGDLELYRSVVEQLAQARDVVDVTAAALKVLHQTLHPERPGEEQEIPVFESRPQRGPKGPAGERSPRGGRDERGPRAGARGPREERGARPRSLSEPVRLFVGVGRSAGLRPGDLVGAIANEAGLDSSEIGAIQITDQFSFVEIPKDRAQDVIQALKRSTIRGRKVKVDLDRGRPKGPPRARDD